MKVSVSFVTDGVNVETIKESSDMIGQSLSCDFHFRSSQ